MHSQYVLLLAQITIIGLLIPNNVKSIESMSYWNYHLKSQY